MGVTYTTRRDRTRWRGRRAHGLSHTELALGLIGVVSILAMSLAYVGRLRASDTLTPPGAVVNLNAIDDDALDAALATVFVHTPDRRFAASQVRTTEALPNVGALARLDVPAASIDGTSNLVVFKERLDSARTRAAGINAPPPVSIPVFTSSDLATLKPLMIVRTRAEHRTTVVWYALAFVAVFPLVAIVWRVTGIGGDRVLLAAAHLLATLGFLVMLSRPDPLRDTLLIGRYTLSVAIGLGVFLVASVGRVRTSGLLKLSYLALAAAVALSIILVVFGSGPGGSGAKVNLGPVQPIEAIRLLVAVFMAGYLGRRWELVRQIHETDVRGRQVPSWLRVPRLDHLLPVAGGVGVALLLFFVLRDLGPALLVSLTFLAMLAVARARPGVLAAGAAVLVAGFSLGYWLGISRTLTARVGMWLSPWDNAVRGGDQVAHAAWAMAAGGSSGTGLGLGDTRYLPAGHTDLVLPALGEELGMVGILVAAVASAVIAWRGLRVARQAPTDTTVFLAVAMTLSLIAPVLVMTAGILGLIPLTGVVTPFISYGGSAMVANFAALGLLSAIHAARDPAADTAPFRAPVGWLARGLAAVAVVLIVAWGRVQVVSADGILVQPQLGTQADGGRRYQYNPRVLDAARLLPRGAIFDRQGLPIAAAPDVVAGAERALSRAGLAARDVCGPRDERCYPFGGPMVHLVGDAVTRANWSASNSSYLERDEEDRLRGFDDHEATVRVDDGEGGTVAALRRDYTELIPLVRHRWEPDHPDVRALTERTHDLRMTIDARLQAQIASHVARAAMAAGVDHAAAVILDADTGEILASVSYPWPTGGQTGVKLGSDWGQTGVKPGSDAWLDRARYGLYPPGSTFKLITAAAALRQDGGMYGAEFSCKKLPDGRVGAQISGLGRPVRDDVLDREPHGTIAMRQGLVQSCNAYFAQLATRLGTPALASTAVLAGLTYPTAESPERLRDNLPYAGYGQGVVLATPLRMARVAATIASDGNLREPSLVLGDATPEPTPFLPASGSSRLARYMRDAVTDGTGRLLRAHPGRIAGKTGTAEVDEAASHSWFVGFAPAGSATRRIAFAVILENAGYGGGSAAALAGQLVTTATSLGYVK